MKLFDPIKNWLTRTWACVGWSSLNALEKLKIQILMTQSELAVQLTALTTQLQHIGDETSATLQKVNELETALNNAGEVSPEVLTALAALKAQAQATDDLVPDQAPPTEPAPAPATDPAPTTDPVTTQG